MKKFFIILTLFLPGWLSAQQPERDPLQQYLVPPDLIMNNQHTLDLSDEQREYMIGQIQQAQSEFTSLQWNLKRETEKMASLLEASTVIEKELLDQLDKVLDLERTIKRTHLLLAVRLRNHLTEEQREKLQELRKHHRPGSSSGSQPRGRQ